MKGTEGSCSGQGLFFLRKVQCGYLSFQCTLLDSIWDMRNECHVKKQRGKLEMILCIAEQAGLMP